MRGLTTVLCVYATQTTLRGLIRRQQAVKANGLFETLEECEKAYNELLGKDQVTTTPDYIEEATTTTTTTVSTTPQPPMRRGDVGTPDHTEAKPAYKPPASQTGEPSNELGWDYNEHGDDWTSSGVGAACGGSGQSPIDIVKYVDIGGQTKSVLWFDYYADPDITPATEGHLVNDGHGIFYNEPKLDMGFVKIGTDEFEAYEYVFHAPSEHTIDGQLFPLEVQVNHKDASGKKLSVSVLFKYGAPNAFLAAVKEAVPDMPKWSVEADGAVKATITGAHPEFFNLEDILPMGDTHPGGDMTFYNYEGSMTSPPCTEGVAWWVSAEPVEAEQDQIQQIRKAIIGADSTKHGNNRVTQPLNGRKVLVGHTGFQHHVKHHGHKAETKPDSRGYNSQDTPWVAAAPAAEAEAAPAA